jgi:hypothetical protein
VHTAFIFALDALSSETPPGVQRHVRDNFRDMPLRPVAQSLVSCRVTSEWPERELNPRHADFQSGLRVT